MFEPHLYITGKNSCGQGYCPNHMDNPHWLTLREYGWDYSHTTIVNHVGARIAHHTYRFNDTDWVIGVQASPGWPCHASRLGSGRQTTLFGSGLKKYLKRKTRELRS